MQLTENEKNAEPFRGMQSTRECNGKEPMHPDDFNALYAWVTAKRCHEITG